MNRKIVSSGSKWEPIVGYSRAVRVGPFIAVSGTTATGPGGEVVGIGNPYEQTRAILRKIQSALEEMGATLGDVVRTRIFVTDISRWDEVGRAHREFFEEIRPAATMVEVKSLIDKHLLVEIEAEAYVG
jgi:enamine deaminase RidA (YjgF/YER057c/UK114 family)